MAKKHIVKQGETLSSIALANGFRNFHTIFDDPSNAGLRAKRDAHVLLPGDELFIPDPKDRTESRPAGAAHRFVADVSALLLRLRLLDVNGQAIAGAPCDVGLESDQPPDTVNTDTKGILEEPVEATVRKGEVVAHIVAKKTPPPPPEQKVKFELRIGHLNPEFKLSGQQARLNNLGYFAGFALTDLDQLLWAAEEFSCDKISKPVTKRPKITPAPPQGEDDETKAGPAPTGITDTPIVTKLKQEHGI